MYVLYCGEGAAPDKSRWTPGVKENENKPITLSNNCYRVKRPNSGAIMLTGDAVHFRDNWDTPRAPVQHFDKAASIKSVEKRRGIVAANNARGVDQPR